MWLGGRYVYRYGRHIRHDGDGLAALLVIDFPQSP
jgi:hypothetical protein